MLDVFQSFTPAFYFLGVALAMTFVFALTMVELLQTIGAERE